MAEDFPTPEIVDRDEVHLAVVREKVAFTDIPSLYDRAFPLLFLTLGEAGIDPSAPPMGVVHGSPSDSLDLSVAVPIAAPYVAAEGADPSVTAETIPAARTATLLVQGDFSRLSGGYEHLFAWIADQGLEASGVAWEQYLTEPTPGGDPAENATLLGAPLAS